MIVDGEGLDGYNSPEADEERIGIMENEILERKRNLGRLRARVKEYERSLKTFVENIKEKREERIQLYKDKEKAKKQLDRDFLPDIVKLTREIARAEDEISELNYYKQEILKNQKIIHLKESELEIIKHFEKILKDRILGENKSEKEIKNYMENYMKEFLEMNRTRPPVVEY